MYDFNVPVANKVKRPYRVHLLGLVHLPVSEQYMGCAFTQKIVKMSKMLLSLGHEVYLYGAEGSDAPCTEHIQTHTLKQIRSTWGDGDNRYGVGYNWHRQGFRHDFNTERKPVTVLFNKVAAEEINRRKREDDFLFLMQGEYQRPVADQVNLYMTCEPGIGYRGSYATFRAFESAYLMNFTYGSQRPFESIDGAVYDRVIPNYFDDKDFTFGEEKEDYYFYIGRMIKRKGVWWAIQAVEKVGGRLVLAGQTDPEISIESLPPFCKFVGYVEPEERTRLMSKARAVFVPTIYLEAFGGVNVEAQLCGTPVITSNWGVFPETVVHGETGFLCNTLDDLVEAARAVIDLDPHAIRKHAERYLMKNVRWEFQKWMDDIYQNHLSVKTPGVPGWSYVSND